MQDRLFNFSSDDLRHRFADHWEIAQSFLRAMEIAAKAELDEEVGFSVNRRRLFLTIKSAYDDIARYKNYHQEDPWKERLDATKRGAFLMKWIVRFKPIEPTIDDKLEPALSSEGFDRFEIINELFAVAVAENHLSQDLNKNIALSESKRYELVYDLLFREINADGWIAVLQLIKDAGPWAKQIPFLDELADA